MPELPEVETIVRGVGPKLIGRTIRSISLPFPGCLSGDREECIERLCGRLIHTVARRGKYILLYLDDGTVLSIHLRMTGKLVFEPAEHDRPYIRLVMHLDDETVLFFIDTRKFGRIRLWRETEEMLPDLGPEPLGDLEVFAALHGVRSNRAIKTILLDQRILAGIGNIYADEALFAARIHPEAPQSRLTRSQLSALAEHIPLLLMEAVARRGTTLRNYRTADDAAGENRPYLSAYGREGLPCCRCRTPIRRIRIAGRSSYFCPKCQRRGVGREKPG